MSKPIPELQIIEDITRTDLTGKPIKLALADDGGLFSSGNGWDACFKMPDHKRAWYCGQLDTRAILYKGPGVGRGLYRGQVMYRMQVAKRVLRNWYEHREDPHQDKPCTRLQREQEDALAAIFEQLEEWADGLLEQEMVKRIRMQNDSPILSIPAPQPSTDIVQAIKMLASIAVEKHEPMLQEHERRLCILEDRRRVRGDGVTMWVACEELFLRPLEPVTQGNAVLVQYAGYLLRRRGVKPILGVDGKPVKAKQRDLTSPRVFDVDVWRREDAYAILGELTGKNFSDQLK